jgi:hypothetical protein
MDTNQSIINEKMNENILQQQQQQQITQSIPSSPSSSPQVKHSESFSTSGRGRRPPSTLSRQPIQQQQQEQIQNDTHDYRESTKKITSPHENRDIKKTNFSNSQEYTDTRKVKETVYGGDGKSHEVNTSYTKKVYSNSDEARFTDNGHGRHSYNDGRGGGPRPMHGRGGSNSISQHYSARTYDSTGPTKITTSNTNIPPAIATSSSHTEKSSDNLNTKSKPQQSTSTQSQKQDDTTEEVDYQAIAEIQSKFDLFRDILAKARSSSGIKKPIFSVTEIEKLVEDTPGPTLHDLGLAGSDFARNSFSGRHAELSSTVNSDFARNSFSGRRAELSSTVNAVGTRVNFPNFIKPWCYVKVSEQSTNHYGSAPYNGSTQRRDNYRDRDYHEARDRRENPQDLWDAPSNDNSGFVLRDGVFTSDAQSTKSSMPSKKLGEFSDDGTFLGNLEGGDDSGGLFDELGGDDEEELEKTTENAPTSSAPSWRTKVVEAVAASSISAKHKSRAQIVEEERKLFASRWQQVKKDTPIENKVDEEKDSYKSNDITAKDINTIKEEKSTLPTTTLGSSALNSLDTLNISSNPWGSDDGIGTGLSQFGFGGFGGLGSLGSSGLGLNNGTSSVQSMSNSFSSGLLGLDINRGTNIDRTNVLKNNIIPSNNNIKPEVPNVATNTINVATSHPVPLMNTSIPLQVPFPPVPSVPSIPLPTVTPVPIVNVIIPTLPNPPIVSTTISPPVNPVPVLPATSPPPAAAPVNPILALLENANKRATSANVRDTNNTNILTGVKSPVSANTTTTTSLPSSPASAILLKAAQKGALAKSSNVIPEAATSNNKSESTNSITSSSAPKSTNVTAPPPLLQAIFKSAAAKQNS